MANTKPTTKKNEKGTADLLFEIGSEELPAGYQSIATNQLRDYFTKKFADSGLRFKSLKTYNTPRRLTVIVEKLSDKQDDKIIEVKGPNTKAGHDDEGNPSRALLGFAKSSGVAVNKLKKVTTDKGEYFFAVKNIKGKKTKQILPELLAGAVGMLNFPKSMRWADYDIKFARPLKWFLSLYGEDVVKFSVGHIKSSNKTYGHRFAKSGSLKPIIVNSVSSYMTKLRSSKVIIDMDERKSIILKSIKKESALAGGKVLTDEGLVEEIANLTEYPVIIRGSFDKVFLNLPRDIVVNAMRDHQRYFSVINSRGKLLPHFLTFSNAPAMSKLVVRVGNERVLRPRLKDAEFYFDKDKAVTQNERLSELRSVVFQKKLGTSFEKVGRITELALHIGSTIGVCDAMVEGETVDNYLADEFNPKHLSRADNKKLYDKMVIARGATLAKTDLVSGVVGEFPKLQGIMGAEYALLSGESEDVATVIRDHYKPTTSGGELPKTIEASIVSIADKLDTMAGCFAVGLVPTGTQDPYALRRQSLGVIAIILKQSISINIDTLVYKALELVEDKIEGDVEEIKAQMLAFVKERFRNYLLTQKYPFDAVEAVLATQWQDISDTVKRVAAITKFKKNPASVSMAGAFKRISNILKDTKFENEKVDEALFEKEVEAKLYSLGEYVKPIVIENSSKGNYEEVFEALATLKDDTDSFFDEVMVMVDDEQVKKNRLVLLYNIRSFFSNIADISKLVG